MIEYDSTTTSTTNFYLAENDSLSIDYSNQTFCGEKYDKFWEQYFPDQMMLTFNLSLCCFGVLGNFLSILVFTRKEMWKNPINIILLGISISDLVLMCVYIPEYILRTEYFRRNYPKSEIIIYIIYWNVLKLFHGLSVFQTVALSIFRYIAVIHPLKSRSFCTLTSAKKIVLGLYLTCFMICLPFFCALKVGEVDSTSQPQYSNSINRGWCNSQYCVTPREAFKSSYTFGRIFQAISWAFMGLCLILPCIILSFVTLRIILSLHRSNKSRHLLSEIPSKNGKVGNGQDGCKSTTEESGKNSNGEPKIVKSSTTTDKSENRTSWMLIAILILFLCTEGPLALANITRALLPPTFGHECMKQTDLLQLTFLLMSGACNFIIYILMSQNYRLVLSTQIFRRGQKSMSKGHQGSTPHTSTTTIDNNSQGQS